MGAIMIQLIGFLLCVYMFVRGLDILSRVEDRKTSRSRLPASTAAWIAIVGAIIFFVLFLAQGGSTPSPNY